MTTIPNIGPRGVQTRLLGGVTALVLGVVVVAGMVVGSAPRAWRLAALPIFWLGALGWFQAREKT